MDRAIKRTGKNPKVVISDKLASYLDVNYEGAEHIQGSPFKVKSSGESTSQIERFPRDYQRPDKGYAVI